MSFKKILSSIAPFIGSMIGGPFGAAASKVIGEVLLDNPNASEKDIQMALSKASPDQLVKLRKVDSDYKTQMAKLGIDEQKIAAMDRDSARKRQIALKDKIPAILSLLLTFGFFGILLSMMFLPIQKEMAGVIDVMLGSLGTAWISVITYYFGSSYGSRIKNEFMKPA